MGLDPHVREIGVRARPTPTKVGGYWAKTGLSAQGRAARMAD